MAGELPSADGVLARAEVRASVEHKNILLVFGASWCEWCHKFDQFARSPEIRPIFEKNFVKAELSVDEEAGGKPNLNSPGATRLLSSLGGDPNGGIPFIAFLDARGRVIVPSNRPVPGKKETENIGYPAAPEEIDWFMSMLKQAAPNLSESAAGVRGLLEKKPH